MGRVERVAQQVLTLALLFSVSVSEAQIVTNGDFESPPNVLTDLGGGSFGNWLYAPSFQSSGWNFAGPAGIINNLDAQNLSAWGATTTSGSQFAFIQNFFGNTGSISQTISTGPGSFQVSLKCRNRTNNGTPGAVNPIRITFGSTAVDVVGVPAADWVDYTFYFFGSGSPQVLSLASTNFSAVDATTFFDAVQITPVSSEIGVPRRVSVSSTGVQGNANSLNGAFWGNDRFVVFNSVATNLVAADGNGASDLFLHELASGITERISVSSTDEAGNAGSVNGGQGDLSGRYRVFYSDASNFAPFDSNNASDVFLRDQQLGHTILISKTPAGVPGNARSRGSRISSDGRYVVFESLASDLLPGDNNGKSDVFFFDRVNNTMERVSDGPGVEGNGDSFPSALSNDGRFVLFNSRSTNMGFVDTNNGYDLFLRDRLNGTTSLISRAPGGGTGNLDSGFNSGGMSQDGEFIVFESGASDLVPGDTNGTNDVFLYQRSSGALTRVSLTNSGAQANGLSDTPRIDDEGRRIVFRSFASNLVEGDANGFSDVFEYDRHTRQVKLLSRSESASQLNNSVFDPIVNRDGAMVAFSSFASNVVPSDTNGFRDVFVIRTNTNPALSSPTITGKLTFRDYVGSTQGLRATFQLKNGANVVETIPDVYISPQGWYLFVPTSVGNYEVTVKVPHWLRRSLGTFSVGQGNSGLNGELFNGDSDDSGEVDASDIDLVIANFGGADPMTDVDGSGEVDAADIDIVIANFGRIDD